jgi:hypothetical protein
VCRSVGIDVDGDCSGVLILADEFGEIVSWLVEGTIIVRSFAGSVPSVILTLYKTTQEYQ